MQPYFSCVLLTGVSIWIAKRCFLAYPTEISAWLTSYTTRSWRHDIFFDVIVSVFTSFFGKRFGRCQSEHFLNEIYIFQHKLSINAIGEERVCKKKHPQEKASIMVVWCELRIPSLEITVQWCRTVALVTEFSIHTSQPLKLLLFWTCDLCLYSHDYCYLE